MTAVLVGKPLPVTVVIVPGGPTAGLSAIFGTLGATVVVVVAGALVVVVFETVVVVVVVALARVVVDVVVVVPGRVVVVVDVDEVELGGGTGRPGTLTTTRYSAETDERRYGVWPGPSTAKDVPATAGGMLVKAESVSITEATYEPAFPYT